MFLLIFEISLKKLKDYEVILTNLLTPVSLNTTETADSSVDAEYLPDNYYSVYLSLNSLPRNFKKQKFGKKKKIVQMLFEAKTITNELNQLIEQLEFQTGSPKKTKIKRLVTYHAFFTNLMKEFIIM